MKANKKLSILIASLPQRHGQLSSLLGDLCPQVDEGVEILINIDIGKKIGTKRNELLDSATGEYLCFIDDDDRVSFEYVEKIMEALEENPDVVSIEGEYLPLYKEKKRFVQRLDVGWMDVSDTQYRGCTHLCPIRSSIAKKCKFPETNYGEDRKYEKQIAKAAKTERHISEVIYYYQYNEHKEYKRDI